MTFRKNLSWRQKFGASKLYLEALYVLGEKEMNAKLDADTEVYNNSCVAEVYEALMTQCGHSMPFPKYTLNLVHAMCSEGKTLSIDWSEVCM